MVNTANTPDFTKCPNYKKICYNCDTCQAPDCANRKAPLAHSPVNTDKKETPKKPEKPDLNRKCSFIVDDIITDDEFVNRFLSNLNKMY